MLTSVINCEDSQKDPFLLLKGLPYSQNLQSKEKGKEYLESSIKGG